MLVGHPSLPKFDHNDQALRRALYEGPDSTVAKWLGEHSLGEWRIDVANMTRRLGTTDLNHMLATTFRATMAEANPESLLLVEHSHDASADLLGDGWHGVMDYAGFSRPVWQWLKRPEPLRFEPGPFTPMPTFGGTSMVPAMRSFSAARPWCATAHALTLIGSHDVPRIARCGTDASPPVPATGPRATPAHDPMLPASVEIKEILPAGKRFWNRFHSGRRNVIVVLSAAPRSRHNRGPRQPIHA